MSDTWVHAYPLDGYTQYHRDDIETLAGAARLAATSADSAGQLIINSAIAVNTYQHHAPLTHPVASQAVFDAMNGPAGVVALAEAARELGESLESAQAVYEEAEWTIERAIEAYRPILALRRLLPNPAFGSTAAERAAVALAIIARIAELALEGNSIELQSLLRGLSVELQTALQVVAGGNTVDTRDGPQYLSDRGPVQGAALLLLVWANLADVHQDVDVWPASLIGSPPESGHAPSTVASIGGVPDALHLLEETSSRSADVGRISIVSHEQPDGTTAWTVLIPGTQTAYGGGNPQDNESNLELTADLSSELMDAVVEAMRSAPIDPADAVTLVGHSQGGIVATALASRTDLRKEFNIVGTVTAGSPVGQYNAIPDGVRSLHLEDVNDTVPALDGAANTASEQHVTVLFDPSDVAENPHGNENYADLVETVQAQGNSPELDRMTQQIGEGAGWSDGGEAELYLYEFERTEPSEPLTSLIARKVLEQ